jgi:transglutaminase-like putative cysteine protease
MQFKSLLFCLLCFSVALNAQNFKYGKVSKEELAEKQNASYPEADATVLYRSVNITYSFREGEGFSTKTEVHERVKIYNKNGEDWATRKFKTYNHGADRETFDIKGATFNLVNGSVEKEKLKNSAVFEERINKYRVNNKITMPDIAPGSVIEYVYTITSPFSQIDDIQLQYTIPIKAMEVVLKVPEYFVYNTYSNPQSPLSFNFDTDTEEGKILFRARTGIGDANSKGREESTTTYKINVFELNEANIPPLAEEQYVDNLSNYVAKSIWELSMINNPGGVPKRYATTWEAVSKSLYESDDFVNEINKNDYYQPDLTNAIAGASTDEEKMASILSLVKSKVKWNEYYGYFPDKGVKKAYKEGAGNVGDINLMLVSMLQSAGLDAYPVLVSTKENGIPVYPTREGFNYIIAAATVNGTMYLLDGTAPFGNINMLPERAMNWQGRLIRPDGTSDWVGLYPGYVSKKLTYVQATIDGETITANVRERKGEHFSREYRNSFAFTNSETQIKAIDIGDEAVAITEFETKDLKTTKPNMSISYSATSSSLVEEIAGDLYISPMLFFAQTENPFKDDTRSYPIFFEYPKSQKYNISIKIPEGYKVKSIPEAIKASLANNTGGYSYLISEASGMVQLAVSLDLNTPIVLPQDYAYIKGMFTQITEKEKEKIVLTKI